MLLIIYQKIFGLQSLIIEGIIFTLFSWYHNNLKRDEAEDMLKRVRKNGAYLVRRKESEQPAAVEQSELENQSEMQIDESSSYAISFRLVMKKEKKRSLVYKCKHLELID